MEKRKRFGECLVEASFITEEQLEAALRLQKEEFGFLGTILLEKGWITDEQLCRGLSEALDVNCVSLDNILIIPEIIRLIPDSLAVTCDILPLFEHRNMLYLAMENPYDTGVIQLVEYETGMQVKPLTAPLCQLQKMIRKYYHIQDPEINVPESGAKGEKSGIEKKITREIGLGQRKRLGDFLMETGLITQGQLDAALQLQEEKRGFLGQLLVDMGWIREEELCQALSDMLLVENVIIDEAQIDPEAIKFVPESLAASCNVFPLFVDHNTLYLAMENPLNTGVIQLLQYNIGMRVEPLVAPSSQIREIIRTYYRSGKLPER